MMELADMRDLGAVTSVKVLDTERQQGSFGVQLCGGQDRLAT